jgi:LPXTG-motif cell wall-anchored protein
MSTNPVPNPRGDVGFDLGQPVDVPASAGTEAISHNPERGREPLELEPAAAPAPAETPSVAPVEAPEAVAVLDVAEPAPVAPSEAPSALTETVAAVPVPSAGTLPVTGSEATTTALLALALILAGVLALVRSRTLTRRAMPAVALAVALGASACGGSEPDAKSSDGKREYCNPEIVTHVTAGYANDSRGNRKWKPAHNVTETDCFRCNPDHITRTFYDDEERYVCNTPS